MLFVQFSKYSISIEIHPRMAWIYDRSKETVEGGAASECGGVSRMDAAAKLTGTYLRRPPHSDTAPPNHGIRFCSGV
ncbi:hypothetical protein D7Y24_21210 [Stenotrophomonas maltophilia]|nr:hypothetical protein [Stenotrophomonas maltophilia]